MNTYIKDRVSVIIPTHNRAQYLQRALISVLSQNYKNIDVVIINDNSSDNTKQILKNYQNDERITIVNSEKNLGGAQARNIGLDMVQGEFIAFLDDDDEWLPNKITDQLNVFNNYSNCDIVFCNYYKLMPDGYKYKVKMKQVVSLNDILKLNYIGSFSFTMVRKSALQNLRIIDNIASCQDWDLWTKILSENNSIALNTNNFSVNYRIHDNIRISNSKDSVYKGYKEWFDIHKNLMDSPTKEYHKIVIKEKQINYNLLSRIQNAFQYTFSFQKIGLSVILFKIIINDIFNRR